MISKPAHRLWPVTATPYIITFHVSQMYFIKTQRSLAYQTYICSLHDSTRCYVAVSPNLYMTSQKQGCQNLMPIDKELYIDQELYFYREYSVPCGYGSLKVLRLPFFCTGIKGILTWRSSTPTVALTPFRIYGKTHHNAIFAVRHTSRWHYQFH